LPAKNEADLYCRTDTPKILVGCKSDLPNHISTYDSIKDFAEKNGFAAYFDCSAKLNQNVAIIFYFAARLLMTKSQK
jgi:GTPase SAR1 family protein